MSQAIQTAPTLKSFRNAVNLTAAQVAELLSRRLNRRISGKYVTVIEHRGTRVFSLVRALAEIYQTTEEEIAAAGERQKNIFKSV